MTYKRFFIKKAYPCQFGVLPANTQIDYIDGRIFVNGGMVEPVYYDAIFSIISDKHLNDEYLHEVVVPVNKV